MQPYNIIIAGVGGQGVILAGNIIGDAALSAGYDVKKTDTLGMAQRGGSVVSHLRLADKVYSPLIKKGSADILLAFEKLEATRWLGWLKHGGTVIISNQTLPPLAVSLGNERYPSDEEIITIVRAKTKEYHIVDGMDFSVGLGKIKVLNIFMLGCLSHLLPLRENMWKKSIASNLPQKVLQMNIKAFSAGVRTIMQKKDRNNG